MTTDPIRSRIHPQVRENVARVMVGAIADRSESHYCAGWYIGIETDLWRSDDDPLAAGLRQLAITYDVWPVLVYGADESGAFMFDGRHFRLLTVIEAVRELGAPGASEGEALPDE